ncbi:hypothetical protein [Aeromonas sp. BIGb0445]|uniref:hypothetical protein n=1 Tax=Aeromonas sp. BIGb0445 TaxID=2940593 RepID=UPI002168EED8|nr:hypothetical protein [Aeromonas sp. BIGb0445]MCS3460220.1 hypothetical protein [Aeromonas sp. BIGb0445]MCS3461634.1 hypothetical protein [Aeromonas sp. BIGb0445]
MSKIFHPISQQAAAKAVADLPKQLAARAHRANAYRGNEAPGLRAQAQLHQRWHLLFIRLNRRAH